MQSSVYLTIDAEREEFGALEISGSWEKFSKRENVPLMEETSGALE